MDLRTGLLPILVMGLLIAGCGDQSQRQFRQDKRQFAIVMKSKLNQFDRRAADLALQVQTDSVHTVAVDSLRGSHGAFRERIAAVDGATMTQWKEIKSAMEAEYYDLERRYYEIASAVAAQEAIMAAVDTLDAEPARRGTAAKGAKIVSAGTANAATDSVPSAVATPSQ